MSEANENSQVKVAFSELGLAPKLLEAIARLNFENPTPIQAKAIPAGLEGKDIFGIAQTGTGKTLAFGLPMLQRIARQGGRGLVVLPTRELALQVDESLRKVAGPNGLRTAILIGGASMQPQLDQLRAKPHVIVATPGRILDHLQQKNLSLQDVRVLVLDEADRMMDMGFMPQVRRILMATPKERQTMMFSATLPDEIAVLAERYMCSPVRVEVDRSGTPAELVDHKLYVLGKDEKNRMLDHLLGEFAGTVLVFTRTRHGAARVCRAVRRMGHRASEIHSDRSLSQRRAALDGFKNGSDRVLVATDIAARGIDVSDIELVVNYDVPDNPEDYVHRIGRTGRAGQKGLAITLATGEQGKEIQEIEKLAQIMLEITSLPELPPDRPRSFRNGHSDRSARRDQRPASSISSDKVIPAERSEGKAETAPKEGPVTPVGKRGPSRFARRERPGRGQQKPLRTRGGAIHANSDGPVGFAPSDLGDLMPEIGASFFEGTIDSLGARSNRSGKRRSRDKVHSKRRKR